MPDLGPGSLAALGCSREWPVAFVPCWRPVFPIVLTNQMYTSIPRSPFFSRPRRILRHPSYCGGFWWAIGTQVFLGNIASTPLYALAAWFFFRDRIPFEEMKLEAFFGADYRAYMARTHIGIPYFRGFQAPEHRNLE